MTNKKSIKKDEIKECRCTTTCMMKMMMAVMVVMIRVCEWGVYGEEDRQG
jgi:hypothetical protein